MANVNKPVSFALAAVAVAGTSVAPSVPVPDNCVAFAIQNPHATRTVLWGIGVPGVAITAGTNGASIAPGNSVTIPIGPASQRGPMDQAQLAGSGLILDATGAVDVVITYQNALGQGV